MCFHAGNTSLDDHEDDEHETEKSQMMIPWVRSVISGVGIMRHPKYNKGAPLLLLATTRLSDQRDPVLEFVSWEVEVAMIRSRFL
jgi:hypothetical protein